VLGGVAKAAGKAVKAAAPLAPVAAGAVNPALGVAVSVGKGVLEYKAAKSRAKAQAEAVSRVEQLAAQTAAPPTPATASVPADALERLEQNDRALAAQLVALQSRGTAAASTPPGRYAAFTTDKRAPSSGGLFWVGLAALVGYLALRRA